MKFDLNWAGLMAQGYFAGLPERISRIADSDDEYPQNPGFSAPVRILGRREAPTRLTFINQRARQGLPTRRTPARQSAHRAAPVYDHTGYWSFFHAADLHAEHGEALCSSKAPTASASRSETRLDAQATANERANVVDAVPAIRRGGDRDRKIRNSSLGWVRIGFTRSGGPPS